MGLIREEAVEASTVLPSTELSLLEDLLDQRALLSEEYKRIDKTIKERTAQIKDLMTRNEQTSLVCGHWAPKFVPMERRTLDKTLLLENGVTADVIEKSYTSKIVQSFRVDLVRGDGNGGE